MAPKSLNPAASLRPDNASDFDPPPSTMAAQLINNLSASNKPSISRRPSDQDALKALMLEVSSTENSSVPFASHSANLAHKHKLIYVFARSVLERLASDDPFLDVPTVVVQAYEALDVFIGIVKESPDVLGWVVGGEARDERIQGRGREPLWVWLFPRILALLGSQRYDGLGERIKDFFYVSFQAVAMAPKLWNLTSFFFCYLKECASAVLNHFQKNSAIVSTGHMVNLSLPHDTINTSMFSYEKDDGLLDAILGCTYVIRDAASGLWHAANVLSMLVDISMESASSHDATPAFQDYLAWILESFLMIHDLQKRWEKNPALQEACKKSKILSFCTVHTLLLSLRKFLPDSILRKGYTLLSILCADLLLCPTDLAEKMVKLNLCSSILNLVAICQEHDSMRRVLSLHLIPAVQSAMADENASSSLGKDFQKAGQALCQACGAESSRTIDADAHDSFESAQLGGEVERLGLDSFGAQALDDPPPSKRRKIELVVDLLDQVTGKLYSLLGPRNVSDLASLSQVTEPFYTELDNADRCKAIEYLAMIPCAAAGSLQVTHSEDGIIRYSSCNLCEGIKTPESLILNEERCEHISTDALATLVALVNSKAFQESRKPRVLAMIALKRFTVHLRNPEFLQLDTQSILGEWCLRSLTSSIRELRIAAGRALPGFLRGTGLSHELMHRNRFLALSLLRSISLEGAIQLQESCILALGQIGRTLNDDELNIVLHKLVEYLGHSNPIISGAAFNEILALGKASDMTIERMFSPFWDTLAIVAVEQLLVRPQASQLMADLLGKTVQDFVILTQSSTLPILVASGKIDIIKRIERAQIQARKDKKAAERKEKEKKGGMEYENTNHDNDPGPICNQTANLTHILAVLLVQTVPDTEEYILNSLKATSSQLEDIDMTSIMRTAPATVALHLLKDIGDADDSKKSRILHGLAILTRWAPSGYDNTKRKSNTMGAFLEQHILGLVARLSEVVTGADQTISEKKRCVRAMDEMVKIGKSFTRTARPHICACLQAALGQQELQVVALAAWKTMLMNLEDEDVELMIESTFSTIIQRWDSFDEETRKLATTTLQFLLRDRARLIRNAIVNIPSLSQYPVLKDIEEDLNRLRSPTDPSNRFQIFSRRVGHENSGVVLQALVELKAYLKLHQAVLQASAVSDQPDLVVGLLVRAILDACTKFSQSDPEIAQLSGECIGLIGCLDPNRVESIRAQREMVVVSNFVDPVETTDFVLFILEEVIVKAFVSATDTGVQGFLSYVMQELLKVCNADQFCVTTRLDFNPAQPFYLKWLRLPVAVQDTLTPFLSSKYSVAKVTERPKIEYPIFRPESPRPEKLYINWLKNFVLDLLLKAANPTADLVFTHLRRAIKIRDGSVASFLLPYAVLHVVVDGSDNNRQEIGAELLSILQYEVSANSRVKKEELQTYSEAVFRVLDYFSRWIQEKQLATTKPYSKPTKEEGFIIKQDALYIKRVEDVLKMIPAEIISQRAVECKSYSRALFYWEQHIRQVREVAKDTTETNSLLERLQDIYTQIDEPDGIEGISAHLHVLDIDQQILGHRKAGRWTAAQSWYEIKLAEDPDNVDVQVNLLTCLKESGQHDVLLNYVEGMHTASKTVSRLVPFATEASWATGRWLALDKYTSLASKDVGEVFNVSIGNALLALHRKDANRFTSTVRSLRERIASSISATTSPSIAACHDNLLKFHVLTELEMIAGTDDSSVSRANVLESLTRRLEVIGAYLNDKQYLLGIRRAAMQLSSLEFTKGDIAEAWLTSARLARKGNAMHQSFNAVLHASQLGDQSATIEHARLLWKEGHHRKAIKNLQGAIKNNAFMSHNQNEQLTSFTVTNPEQQALQQNLLTARAHLLLAKWQDSAGQTQSNALRAQYSLAASTHNNWEKGHYYLGRHYNKLLESEKSLSPELQAEAFLTGETAKLVVESYLRSLTFGTKYIYQTLPRLLTLWLDLGTQVLLPIDIKYGNSKEFVTRIVDRRKEVLSELHNRFSKYISKLPAYIFYTALPQIIARIAHPNAEVYKYLQLIIIKVVGTHPAQALWSLLAVCTSVQSDRKSRGLQVLQALRNIAKRSNSLPDVKMMIKAGEKLTSELLMVCNGGEFRVNKLSYASLSRDLNFSHTRCMPSPLAVPIESVLTATLPTLTDGVRSHKAFSRDVVTISSFLDEVLVLNSLQKPRKLTARGSDGRTYGLLCKPKDDLRKDQRLMEFNSMINRSLKRDAESSRRQLYIKTYAVTPLNEECGIIEWVDGLKTLRDILLGLYKPLGISPNYHEIEIYCQEAAKGPDKLPFFTEKVLAQFPPIFHIWFVQQFPEPSAWFAARLRYTRSCAVMSMVGTILGLGDRHGENILFEEGNGGTFHVDFNCLFDKGLTFKTPERVPFRLTHNMIDAMGIYGYEGPFRKSSELTLKLLRQHEETLMTILEAFVHDPTLDLLAKKSEKKKKEGPFAVPQTAQGVLDSINRKVKGLLAGESVPLGVEGQVDELIAQATDLNNLAAMYIGWCAFL